MMNAVLITEAITQAPTRHMRQGIAPSRCGPARIGVITARKMELDAWLECVLMHLVFGFSLNIVEY